MDEPQRSTVTRLSQRNESGPEGRRLAGAEPQPERLLGELSRASQSLAEVLDSLTAEKRELEAHAAELEREVARLREDATTARTEALAQIRRADEERERHRATAAREVARSLARAERLERLLAALGGERDASTFSVTVGRFSRQRASRDLLRQAIDDGVQLRLSAHHGWFDSLLVGEVEGEREQLRHFQAWVAERFSKSSLAESH